MKAKVFKTTILMDVRMASSKRLLAGETPLAMIAIDCGFCSQAHFTTAFRKAVGVTPGKYRRQLRG